MVGENATDQDTEAHGRPPDPEDDRGSKIKSEHLLIVLGPVKMGTGMIGTVGEAIVALEAGP